MGPRAAACGTGGSAIAEERLRNQRLTRALRSNPASVVSWFGAVQAQEYGPAKWGLALRLPPGVTDAVVDRAVNQGRILRTHVLRPTWHFVLPADITWMQELTGPHVHRRMGTYQRQLGLDGRKLARAASVVERALGDAGSLTRAELKTHIARAKLPVQPIHLVHYAMYAEVHGLICSGPRRGKQPTYALIADRAPRSTRLTRDEALAELGKRFLRGHAPATVRDFVWWSGLSTADAKRAFEMNRARPLAVDGLTYWTLGERRASRGKGSGVYLLPIYDEYLVAYRDRRAVPHPQYSLGAFWNSLVIDGQLAGTWRTARRGKEVAVHVSTLRRLTVQERRGVSRAAARYGRFLAEPVSVTIT